MQQWNTLHRTTLPMEVPRGMLFVMGAYEGYTWRIETQTKSSCSETGSPRLRDLPLVEVWVVEKPHGCKPLPINTKPSCGIVTSPQVHELRNRDIHCWNTSPSNAVKTAT